MRDGPVGHMGHIQLDVVPHLMVPEGAAWGGGNAARARVAEIRRHQVVGVAHDGPAGHIPLGVVPQPLTRAEIDMSKSRHREEAAEDVGEDVAEVKPW